MCPSCLHTTLVSNAPQPGLHTPPQPLFIHTSILPSYFDVPPTNLMSPSVQEARGNELPKRKIGKHSIISIFVLLLYLDN